MKNKIILPAEWSPQSAIQLTFPHEETDWKDLMEEVLPCFISIAQAIIKYERLLIVAPDIALVKKQLGIFDESKVLFKEMDTNDTWARDHAGISVFMDGKKIVYDFVFNAWGMKFASDKDNLITRMLFQQKTFAEGVERQSMSPIVLEGGSLESDGEGTLLTTEECLLSPNRNDHLTKEQVENTLKECLGVERVLWLKNGYLAGDDTDSHVDTLARFCSPNTIAYVKCTEKTDEHYDALKAMEEELKTFTRTDGTPYTLLPLPMADPVEWEGERLPATYANFLIMNNAVLLPFYDSPKDEVARAALQTVFPDREIIGINCLPLIKQHGSLHCVTMQYPEGFL